jgi:hypothetical protein
LTGQRHPAFRPNAYPSSALMWFKIRHWLMRGIF